MRSKQSRITKRSKTPPKKTVALPHPPHATPQTPDTQTIHHAWKASVGVSPRIVSITTVRGPHTGTLSRIFGHHWIFDYEWEPYGRIGTGGPDPAWRDRPARTMHLYPASTAFWEDVRGATGQRDSAWIFFDDDARTLAPLLHPRLHYRRIEDPTGQLGDWFHELSDLGQIRGNSAAWHANAILFRLIDATLNAQVVDDQTLRFDPHSDAKMNMPTLLEQVEQFIKPRLGEPIRVADIARRLHMSESSLAHRLRDEAGVSPMSLLTRLRIDQAKSLLVRGVPLKTIAPSLGFCDEFHLSRTIKRLEGKTARELRRASRGG